MHSRRIKNNLKVLQLSQGIKVSKHNLRYNVKSMTHILLWCLFHTSKAKKTRMRSNYVIYASKSFYKANFKNIRIRVLPYWDHASTVESVSLLVFSICIGRCVKWLLRMNSKRKLKNRLKKEEKLLQMILWEWSKIFPRHHPRLTHCWDPQLLPWVNLSDCHPQHL